MNRLSEIAKLFCNHQNKRKRRKINYMDGKKITKKGISLILSIILVITGLIPLFNTTFFSTKAADVYFGSNYLDGSTGAEQIGWKTATDPRYSSYSTGFVLGAETTPYIVKNGDELYSLAVSVNSGTSYANSYIDVTGLSEAEAITIPPYGTAGVIDLRPYDGTSKSAGASVKWQPIGTSTHQFSGNLYSSTGVSIINLTYIKNESFTDPVFGLFGYNSGTIGGKGGQINVSAIKIPTSAATGKELNFSVPEAQNIKTIGGVAAINSGTIKNVNFGKGKYYDIVSSPTKKEDNFFYNNSITLSSESAQAKEMNVGGITGINTGTISDCYFDGSITAASETIVTDSSVAQAIRPAEIGGITGSTSGKIENCVSSAVINLNKIAQDGKVVSFKKIGGIAGIATAQSSSSQTCIKNSVFTGAITLSSDYSEKLTGSAAGGIAGIASNFLIENCVFSGDVTFIASGAANGITGGIVGTASGSSTISGCFGLGNVYGGTYVGGLVGSKGGTSTLKTSYFTGSVRGYGDTTNLDKIKSAKSTYYFVGGLIGKEETSSITSNCYFAGSTLNSDIGSLFGEKAVPSNVNVYYDKQLSPNKECQGEVQALCGKTTAEFKNIAISDFTSAPTTYPTLSWVSALPSSDVNGLIKALSCISVQMKLDLTDANSVANGGQYNAYQMKTPNNVFSDFVADSANFITASGWATETTFKGKYNTNEVVGGIYKASPAITAGSSGRYNNIITNIKRKLIKAVNQDGGNANEINTAAEFLRLVDISRFASGAYCGSKFAIIADITVQLDIVSSSEKDNTAPMIDNLFCSELDGGSKSISAVNFQANFNSLFGISVGANLHNINFATVNIGTTTTPIDTNEGYAGFLFSKSKTTAFSDITFGTVNVNVATIQPGFSYGLITAYLEGKSSAKNIQTTNYKMKIGNYSTDKNQIRPDYVSGMFGYVENTDTAIINCDCLSFDGRLDSYEFAGNKGGFSGIVSSTKGDVTDCNVVGKIVGPSGGTAETVAMVAGISTTINNNKKIENCSFVGEIDGFLVGSIAAQTNWGAKTTNCYAVAEINQDPAFKDVNKKIAGGLLGSTSGGNNIENSYFFGTISAETTGGISGKDAGVTIKNSYVKAIIESTNASGYAGGLVGNSTGKIAVNGSYFAGQLNGAGSKGGIAGAAKSDSSIANSFFDKSIVGKSTPTVASITAADNAKGEALDAQCAKATDEITNTLLSTSSPNPYTISTNENYPQLTLFASPQENQKNSTMSTMSTQKIFKANVDSFLTSKPNFELISDTTSAAKYTVTRKGDSETVLPDQSYKPWNEILTYTQGTQTSPYGIYREVPGKIGKTAFVVTYDSYIPGKKLEMIYSISILPFDYGSGTQADPYIIYNNAELIKYRDYLKNGNDSSSQYYKIGSINAGKIEGKPISLDLTEYTQWEPIVNVAGNLDGNNSIIKNIICPTGYEQKDNNGQLIATFFGFFGSSTNSAKIKNLTLDNVNISTTINNQLAKIGTFMGQSAGGTYTNIVVTNGKINTSSINSTPEVGGLIGSSTADKLTLTKCAIYADITGHSNPNGAAGGIIGAVGLNQAVGITECASYGKINGYQYLGGMVGFVNGKVEIASSASTMDLSSTTTASICGGMIGYVKNTTVITTINNTIYGGKIQSPTDKITNKGGVVGRWEATNVTATNAFYNSNVNPYNDGINNQGKSTTYEMTKGDFKPKIFSIAEWKQELGYYPRPAWLNKVQDTVTQRDEHFIDQMSQFFSIAIFYTNAGVFGDNGFSNVFIIADNANWTGHAGGDEKIKITANQKMLQSVGEGSARSISLNKPESTFTKTIDFKPSVVACAVADYSYFFANKQGMWIDEETKNGATTAFPWSIHTADQLQGLNNLITQNQSTTMQLPDENGLVVAKADLKYNVTPPQNKQLGDTFVLGTDIEMTDKPFTPIGDVINVFSTTFNGLGHTINGLNLVAKDRNIGLFSHVKNGTISNLGISGGSVNIIDTAYTVGAFAANLCGGATIINCFSSMYISDYTTGSIPAQSIVGGLVGKSSTDKLNPAQNTIVNCFNTGAVYAAGINSIAGGIVGDAGSATLSVSNCFVAGYVKGTQEGVFFGNGTGILQNCYYDIGACGDMANNNGASSLYPTKELLGVENFTKINENFYPYPKCFQEETRTVKQAIIPMVLINARSATGGSLTYKTGTTIMELRGKSKYPSVGETSLTIVGGNSFTKKNSGIVTLSLDLGKGKDLLSRIVIANLQCWYDKGLDSQNKIFIINTAEELAEFAHIVNSDLTSENNPNGKHGHTNSINPSFKGWTVKLGSNIDLSKMQWTSIGTENFPFEGTFDGQGFVISNINQTTQNEANSGLFGKTNTGAMIKNLGISGGKINGTGNSGALVANAVGTIISYCFANVDVVGNVAGGIAAKADAATTIDQCYSMGEIAGNAFASGIVAQNSGSVTNCYNTGIVQATTTATVTQSIAGGIVAQNSGSVNTCFNAAYVSGGTQIYPVAPGGTIACGYDGKMLSYVGEVTGVAGEINIAKSNIWIAKTETKYPELAVFSNSSSVAMQDASELSVLKMDFGSGKYSEFVSAKIANSITTNKMTRNTKMTSPSKVFNVASSGNMWLIEPNDTGADRIEAKVESTMPISHKYYAVAKMTMKIRYKFDFSQLFAGNPTPNANYHQNVATTNTWNASGVNNIFTISTAQDLIAFANYANKNETTGKTFILDYNIDMQGQTMPIIGNAAKPFAGTFNGGNYTIKNLNISGNGSVALFGSIASGGKVCNLMLDVFSVTAEKSNSDMAIASIAAENKGTIMNIGITNGKITANNSASNQTTYLGAFAAKNSGKIRGCYFIQPQGNVFGITHYSASNNFVGGMVGDNLGSITGCYLISDMFTNNIKAIAGSNHGKSGNIINCYFNIKGETVPQNLQYAYDGVIYNDFFVKESQMNKKEFARWLSSNLYAGTFEQGKKGDLIGSNDTTIINNGLPYLSSTELVKYDLKPYFTEKNSMMLSAWNMDTAENYSMANGIFALDNLEYKYFKSVITHNDLQFDMSLLSSDIGYEITSRIYGKGASYLKDTNIAQDKLLDARSDSSINAKDVKDTNGTILKSDGNAYTVSMASIGVVKPNLIVVDIKIKKIASQNPWGNFRTWSAT